MSKSPIFALFNKRKASKKKLKKILAEIRQKIIFLRQAAAQAIATKDHLEEQIQKNKKKSEAILKKSKNLKYKDPISYEKVVSDSERYLEAANEMKVSFDETAISAYELRRVLTYFECLVNRAGRVLQLVIIFNDHLKLSTELVYCQKAITEYCHSILIKENFETTVEPYEKLDKLEAHLIEILKKIDYRVKDCEQEKYFDLELQELQDSILISQTSNANYFDEWNKRLANIADIDDKEKRNGLTIVQLRTRAKEQIKHYDILVKKEQLLADFIGNIVNK